MFQDVLVKLRVFALLKEPHRVAATRDTRVPRTSGCRTTRNARGDLEVP